MGIPPAPGVLESPAARDIAHNPPTMRLPTLLAGFIACLITNVTATALTYNIAAHEKACFYAETKKDNEKVAFYFAVGHATLDDMME